MLKRRREFNGMKLTEARELHELTIKALSDITQISRQSLSLYEAGKQVPGPDIINRLVEALRLKWDFFFQESTQREHTLPILDHSLPPRCDQEQVRCDFLILMSV